MLLALSILGIIVAAVIVGVWLNGRPGPAARIFERYPANDPAWDRAARRILRDRTQSN